MVSSKSQTILFLLEVSGVSGSTSAEAEEEEAVADAVAVGPVAEWDDLAEA